MQAGRTGRDVGRPQLRSGPGWMDGAGFTSEPGGSKGGARRGGTPAQGRRAGSRLGALTAGEAALLPERADSGAGAERGETRTVPVSRCGPGVSEHNGCRSRQPRGAEEDGLPSVSVRVAARPSERRC